MTYTINPEFALEQIVYIKTEEHQRAHMVTAYTLNMSGTIVYQCSVGAESYYFLEQEISTQKNFTI